MKEEDEPFYADMKNREYCTKTTAVRDNGFVVKDECLSDWQAGLVGYETVGNDAARQALIRVRAGVIFAGQCGQHQQIVAESPNWHRRHGGGATSLQSIHAEFGRVGSIGGYQGYNRGKNRGNSCGNILDIYIWRGFQAIM